MKNQVVSSLIDQIIIVQFCQEKYKKIFSKHKYCEIPTVLFTARIITTPLLPTRAVRNKSNTVHQYIWWCFGHSPRFIWQKVKNCTTLHFAFCDNKNKKLNCNILTLVATRLCTTFLSTRMIAKTKSKNPILCFGSYPGFIFIAQKLAK